MITNTKYQRNVKADLSNIRPGGVIVVKNYTSWNFLLLIKVKLDF